MCKNIVEIIEENANLLSAGNSIKVMFGDGLATIFQDKHAIGGPKIITLLEEVEYRVLGSIHDYQKN
jgi:hypothetical protein